MSVNISPHGKVASNALQGCSYENWLDLGGTVVSIRGHNIIIIIAYYRHTGRYVSSRKEGHRPCRAACTHVALS